MRTALEGIDSPNDSTKKRKQRSDDSKVEKRKLLVTHTRNLKGNDQKNFKPIESKDKNNSKEEKGSTDLPQKRRYMKCYCYFCKSIGHSPNFCKSFKLSFDEKKEVAL